MWFQGKCITFLWFDIAVSHCKHSTVNSGIASVHVGLKDIVLRTSIDTGLFGTRSVICIVVEVVLDVYVRSCLSVRLVQTKFGDACLENLVKVRKVGKRDILDEVGIAR